MYPARHDQGISNVSMNNQKRKTGRPFARDLYGLTYALGLNIFEAFIYPEGTGYSIGRYPGKFRDLGI